MYEKSMSGSHWGHWGTTLIVVSYFLNRKNTLCVLVFILQTQSIEPFNINNFKKIRKI